MRTYRLCKCVSLIVVLLVLGLTDSTADAGNAECVPSSCGDIHNISFPFRLKDDPKQCGRSINTLQCDHNNVTWLRLFSQDYNVKAIDYDERIIRVVDPGLDKNNCSSLPRYHLSRSNFSNLQGYRPLRLDANSVVLFLKCEKPVNSSRYVSTAPCISEPENKYGYVILSTQSFQISPEVLEKGCMIYWMGFTTQIHAWDIGNVSYKYIHSLMADGFQLLYVYDDCYGQWKLTYSRCYPRTVRGFFEAIFYSTRYFLQDRRKIIIIILIVIAAARLIFGGIFVATNIIRKWQRRHWSAYNTIEDFLHTDNFMPLRYSYSNIKKMSSSFEHKLGSGGFGSVFKCKLRSGRFGAIKLLNKSKSNGEDFMSEVATIGRIHHVNVVQLIGYCVEGSKRALVYDFMPNGSLDKYIFANKQSFNTLSNTKMYDIAVGVAQGIEYLHQGCEIQILHFDIKPHNILLDENFVPKISDFGLAKLYPANNSIVSTMAARGTMGYIAPELFYRNIGAVSYKADVYSFGMLLMEMASRRKNMNAAIDHSSQTYFPSWVHDQYNDGKEWEVIGDVTEEEKILIRKMVVVALWCIQMRPSDRPSMKRVIQMLVGNVEDLELPPKPSMYPQLTPESDPQIPTCSNAELTCTLSAR